MPIKASAKLHRGTGQVLPKSTDPSTEENTPSAAEKPRAQLHSIKFNPSKNEFSIVKK